MENKKINIKELLEKGLKQDDVLIIKDKYNYIDCYINKDEFVFTVDNYGQEERLNSLIYVINQLIDENRKLKKENKVLNALNKEQNEVFSLIKENFEIDKIDISIIIEK